MMASGSFSSLTWPAAAERLARASAVVLPVGACLKEHGYHLPLNTDEHLARYFAERLEDRDDLVVLPVLTFGYYPAFVNYPGSVCIDCDTFSDTVTQICRSLHRHAPLPFYVLNTGISTLWSLEPARITLGKHGIRMDYTDLSRALETVEAGVREQARGTHADEIETSMMLAIAPDTVQLERAVRDDEPRRGPGPFSRDPSTPSGIYSRSGAWGDPTLANAAKGRIVIERLIQWIESDIARLLDPAIEPDGPRERFL